MVFGKEKAEVVYVPQEMLEAIQAATVEMNLAYLALAGAARDLKSAAAAIEVSTAKLNQAKRRPTAGR